MDQVLIVEKLDLSPFQRSLHPKVFRTDHVLQTLQGILKFIVYLVPRNFIAFLDERDIDPGFKLVSVPTETRSPNRGRSIFGMFFLPVKKHRLVESL